MGFGFFKSRVVILKDPENMGFGVCAGDYLRIQEKNHENEPSKVL